MGLDMYLTARKSSYKSFGNETDSDERKLMVACADALQLPNIKNVDHITVEREVAYWRKANQIHAYFVREHQNGRDECQRTTLYKEDLQKLRDICQQVIDGTELIDGTVTTGYSIQNGVKTVHTEPGKVAKDTTLAEQLLPAQSGFFFGGTEYDEWYFEQLKSTVEQLDKALAIPGDDVEFIYQASW
jgi:hypothetical protein